MRWVLTLFLFLLLQEAAPEITVDVNPVEPNQVAIIRVTVTNPGTAEMLWGSAVRIEEIHPYFVPLQAEYTLSHEIRPGETDIGEVTFQVKREAEAGEYPLTISLSGGVGSCEEGCVPYFIEKGVTVKVLRNEPELTVSHKIQGTQVVITFKNTGTGKALQVTCDGTTLHTLSPGKSEDITLDKKSTFTITYEDEYGKKFTQSYRIAESTPDTPDTDSSAQSLLVVAGMLAAYFFKKNTN